MIGMTKIKHLMHYRNLKLCVRYSVEHTKTNTVMSFKQRPLFKELTDTILIKRAKARGNKIEENVPKGMTCSLSSN